MNNECDSQISQHKITLDSLICVVALLGARNKDTREELT